MSFHNRRTHAVCATYTSSRLHDRLGMLSAGFVSASRSKGRNFTGSATTRSCCRCTLYVAIIANINVSIFSFLDHGSVVFKIMVAPNVQRPIKAISRETDLFCPNCRNGSPGWHHNLCSLMLGLMMIFVWPA
jgi:hypothetical protein